MGPRDSCLVPRYSCLVTHALGLFPAVGPHPSALIPRPSSPQPYRMPRERETPSRPGSCNNRVTRGELMSDDFGTVNVRRGDRAREIEVMRQRYRAHRDTLQRLAADAPTDHLATEYQRLAGEIDVAMGKLHELEGRGSTKPAQTAPPPPPPRTSAGDR